MEIHFEQGLLQSELNHSNKASELRETYDDLWRQIINAPDELREKFHQWILAPEQMAGKDVEEFKQYFDKLSRLEWSFVEGYEQQPLF